MAHITTSSSSIATSKSRANTMPPSRDHQQHPQVLPSPPPSPPSRSLSMSEHPPAHPHEHEYALDPLDRPTMFASPPSSPSHAGNRRSWREVDAALDAELSRSPPQPLQEWSSAAGALPEKSSKRTSKSSGKGKGKQPLHRLLSEEEMDVGDGAPLRPPRFAAPIDTPTGSPRTSLDDVERAYPPTNEEESETRQIEEVSTRLIHHYATPR
jgi:hypothetical protein